MRFENYSIVKNKQVATAENEGFEEWLPLPKRVPAEKVEGTSKQVGFDVPEFRLTGVLRGEQAQLDAKPLDIGLFLEEPVVPLPPLEEDEPEIVDEGPVYDEVREAALKETWDAEWQARLDAAVEAARAEAYQSGYEQARAELQADFDEQKVFLDHHLEVFETEAAKLKVGWQQAVKASEPELATLAVSLAEAILDAPLSEAVKDASREVLLETIERLADEAPTEVTLHPVDFLRIQELGMVEQLDQVYTNLRWTPDSGLTEGEWIVKTPEAVVRRLHQEMMRMLRERIGLSG